MVFGRLLLPALLLLGPTASSPASDADWASYKNVFGKHYSSVNLERERRAAFEANMQFIQNLLQSPSTSSFQLGPTIFSDLSNEEYARRYLLHRVAQAGAKPPLRPRAMSNRSVSLPTSVDWRITGSVSAVIDQGECGACWAIATAGAIEGAVHIARLARNQTAALEPLSVQQWLECDYGPLDLDEGCQGGNIDSAMEFAKKTALCSAKSYAYTATDSGKCRQSTCDIVVPLHAVAGKKEIAQVPEILPATEAELMEAVANAPVAAWIDASSSIFQHYKSGVLKGTGCGSGKNHAVLIVGYGTDKSGDDYWLVKNSFGLNWGQDGYVLLKRGVQPSQRTGTCGILQWPTAVVLEKDF